MEHILVISWLALTVACCAFVGKRLALRSFGWAIVLGFPITFVTWLVLALVVGLLIEVLHIPLFGRGDNDLIYAIYFFPFPLLAAIALWIEAASSIQDPTDEQGSLSSISGSDQRKPLILADKPLK